MDSDTGLHKQYDEIPMYEDECDYGFDKALSFFVFCGGVMLLMFGAAAIVLAINYIK